MELNKKKLENSVVELTVSLTQEEWNDYKKKSFNKIAKTVKIDGFRKGHVPDEIVRQKVGEESIMRESIDFAISQEYSKALKESKLSPLVQPEVSISKVDPLVFSIAIQVYPDVVLKDEIDLKSVKLKKSKVTKKDIEAQVKEFLKKSSKSKVVDKKVKSGDIAVINFEGKDAEGNTQDGMKGEKYSLEIGSKSFIEGFEDEVIGLKKGEEKTFPIKFPDEYAEKKYAGNEYFFTVKVVEVKEIVLPDLNDEFTQKITGNKENTVDKFKEEIEKHLTDKKKREDYQIAQQEIFKLIGENTTTEIPKIFLDEELNVIMDNVKMKGLSAGIPWEQYLKVLKKTEEELKKSFENEAKSNITSRLGLQALIEKEKISVTEEEVDAEVLKEKTRAEQRKQKVNVSFEKHGEVWHKVKNRLEIRKFFEKYLGSFA